MNIRFDPQRSKLTACRFLHMGKQFLNPITDEIVFKALCSNLRQRRWKVLNQFSSQLTNLIFTRVIKEFKHSPRLVSEFFNWVSEQNNLGPSVEVCCNYVHVLVGARKIDDALLVLRNSMQQNGFSAIDLFDALTDSYDENFSSPVVFDVLVRSCIEIGAFEAAYEVMKGMRVEGFYASAHAWINILNHLVKQNELNKFWLVYKEMISSGYSENVNTFNLIISALCRDCRILEAISVIYRMLKMGFFPDVVSFNLLIDGACKMSIIDIALCLLRKMVFISMDSVRPNIVSYNCLIGGFCKLGCVEFAKDVLLYEMMNMNIEPNVRTYAILIDGLCRFGRLEKGLQLCDEMVKRGLMPNTVIYNIIIYWLYMDGDIEEASLLLSEMVQKHIDPDLITYSILIKGLCRNGYINEAVKYHNQISEKDMAKDNFTHNILINYLLQMNDIAGVKQVLATMFVRGLVLDIVTYGTLIDGYFKDRNIETAFQVYDDMIKMEEMPNQVVCNSVTNGLCRAVSADAGRMMVETVKKRGSFDSITYNTLLNGYLICGRVDEALAVFLEMAKAGNNLINRVTYNTMMNFLCKMGFIEEAKELLKMMASQGITPDFITYRTLVTHASRHCGADRVVALHDDLVLQGAIPDVHTYQSIIHPLVEEKSCLGFQEYTDFQI